MKNKVELKNVIIKSLVIINFLLVIFGVFEAIKYKIYMRNFNEKLGGIVTEILKEDQNIDENEILKILNSRNRTDRSLFEKYGIDVQKDSLILKNEYDFRMFLIADIVILAMFGGLIIFVFVKYNCDKNKK